MNEYDCTSHHICIFKVNIPTVTFLDNPLPRALVPDTVTIISLPECWQIDRDKLKVCLQTLSSQEDAGMSVEPQMVPEAESAYVTV